MVRIKREIYNQIIDFVENALRMEHSTGSRDNWIAGAGLFMALDGDERMRVQRNFPLIFAMLEKPYSPEARRAFSNREGVWKELRIWRTTSP